MSPISGALGDEERVAHRYAIQREEGLHAACTAHPSAIKELRVLPIQPTSSIGIDPGHCRNFTSFTLDSNLVKTQYTL